MQVAPIFFAKKLKKFAENFGVIKIICIFASENNNKTF